MKLNRDADIRIASDKIENVFAKLSPLNYGKWVEFVEANITEYKWKEDTEEGIQILREIDKIPQAFKEGVLQGLNKMNYFYDYDPLKGYYNISVGFSKRNNWVSVSFERNPKVEDLKPLIEMATYIDALLLVNGAQVVTNDNLKDFF